MTTAIHQSHPKGLPLPAEYSAHVEAVLSSRPLSPVQEFRWRCELFRVIGPSAWVMTAKAVRQYRDGIEAGMDKMDLI